MVEPEVEPSGECQEPTEAGVASKLPELSLKEATKLQSVPVTVLEPSKNRVKDGTIRLFSVGRLRSSSTRSSTSSSKGWLFGKDVWVDAELYLTPSTLCYRIEGMGVSRSYLKPLWFDSCYS